MADVARRADVLISDAEIEHEPGSRSKAVLGEGEDLVVGELTIVVGSANGSVAGNAGEGAKADAFGEQIQRSKSIPAVAAGGEVTIDAAEEHSGAGLPDVPPRGADRLRHVL